MNAQSIANAFLNKIPTEAVENGEGMHKVKLQKLLFFAQEEYLFRYKKPLFEDKIEAWQHGPVVREVWNLFCNNPSHIIKSVPTEEKIPPEAQEVVDVIWSKYGEKDTWFLRDLSHSYRIWQEKRASHYNGRGEITPQEILAYKEECEKCKTQARQYIESQSKEFLC